MLGMSLSASNSCAVALIVVAAFAAGVLNTAGGGGAVLSFLAMSAMGVPELTAHATNQLVTPVSFLLAVPLVRTHRPDASGVVMTCVGTVLGVLVLAVTPPELFGAVVPWVLPAAALLVAVQPVTRRRLRRVVRPRHRAAIRVAMLVCGVYAGLVGVGVGTISLVVLGLASGWGGGSMRRLMYTRNVLLLGAAVVTAAGVAVTGLVDWGLAALLVVPMGLGGWVGARLVDRLPELVLLVLVVATAAAGAVWIVW